MTKYLGKKFSSPGNSRAYVDNWDAVFRYDCKECCDTGCVLDPNADPGLARTEGDLLMDCPSCTVRGLKLP